MPDWNEFNKKFDTKKTVVSNYQPDIPDPPENKTWAKELYQSTKIIDI